MAVSLKVLFIRKLSLLDPGVLVRLLSCLKPLLGGKGWGQSGHKICAIGLSPVVFSFFQCLPCGFRQGRVGVLNSLYRPVVALREPQ